MALRTPRPDGLAVAPDAAGDANNPAASVLELEGHLFWGRYSAASVLPNASGNLATGPAYACMRPGDLAYVQADAALYRLIDRGTSGGGDAVWENLAPPSGPAWSWNGTDVSQFEPVAAAWVNGRITSVSLAVAALAGSPNGNELVFQGATYAGGGEGGAVLLAIDPLPSRRCRIEVDIWTANVNGVGLAWIADRDGGGDLWAVATTIWGTARTWCVENNVLSGAFQALGATLQTGTTPASTRSHIYSTGARPVGQLVGGSDTGLAGVGSGRACFTRTVEMGAPPSAAWGAAGLTNLRWGLSLYAGAGSTAGPSRITDIRIYDES